MCMLEVIDFVPSVMLNTLIENTGGNDSGHHAYQGVYHTYIHTYIVQAFSIAIGALPTRSHIHKAHRFKQYTILNIPQH